MFYFILFYSILFFSFLFSNFFSFDFRFSASSTGNKRDGKKTQRASFVVSLFKISYTAYGAPQAHNQITYDTPTTAQFTGCEFAKRKGATHMSLQSPKWTKRLPSACPTNSIRPYVLCNILKFILACIPEIFTLVIITPNCVPKRHCSKTSPDTTHVCQEKIEATTLWCPSTQTQWRFYSVPSYGHPGGLHGNLACGVEETFSPPHPLAGHSPARPSAWESMPSTKTLQPNRPRRAWSACERSTRCGIGQPCRTLRTPSPGRRNLSHPRLSARHITRNVLTT